LGKRNCCRYEIQDPLLLLAAGLALLGMRFTKKNWTIAIPVNNSKYENCADLLQKLFVKEGGI